MNEVITNTDHDPLGNALLDYHVNQQAEDIRVHSSLFESDIIPVAWFFRTYDDMPEIEKKALMLCSGKILDVGAGAGAHTLCLQEQGKQCVALEISRPATRVMQERGVKEVWWNNFFKLPQGVRFDTLLLLMNGIGLCGTIQGLQEFLQKAGTMLHPDGKIIFDSSDVSYLYEQEDGSVNIDINSAYHGEIDFRMQYKKIKGPSFHWLYIDFDTLSYYAEMFGFIAELITSENYHYLACLTQKEGNDSTT
jgi:hypothetical protein